MSRLSLNFIARRDWRTMTSMDETPKDIQEGVPPVSSPGAVITPTAPTTDSTLPPPAAPIAVPQPPAAQIAAPTPAPLPSQPAPIAPENTAEQPLAQTEVPTPPEAAVPASMESESEPEVSDGQAVSWTASEFQEHQKSAAWYFLLIIITVAVAAALYFLTKSIVTTVVIAVSGLIIGIYAARKPGELNYSIDNQGIRIGTKQYQYDDFRLFVVTPALSIPEVTLVPVKRFMPSLSVRYSPEVSNKVLGLLGEHLPFEERRPDLIDSFMHKIHF